MQLRLTHCLMHGIFQMSYWETRWTLSDPDIYIEYQNVPNTTVWVLFQCTVRCEGTDSQKVDNMLVALQIHAGGFWVLFCQRLLSILFLEDVLFFMLNVDRSGLLTICIYSHAGQIRNLIAPICYTLCLRKTSHYYSLHTDLWHQPCISSATVSKPPFIDNETRSIINSRTNIASAVMHSVFSESVDHNLGAWAFTSDEIRLRSRKEPLCSRNWSKIWHAQEVCRGGKVSSHRGYRIAYSSHCLFVLCQSSNSLFDSLGLSTFCRSHSLPCTIPLSLSVSLITFLYLNCSYQ